MSDDQLPSERITDERIGGLLDFYTISLSPKARPCKRIAEVRLALIELQERRAADQTTEPKNWAIWQCFAHGRLFAAHAGCSFCKEGKPPLTAIELAAAAWSLEQKTCSPDPGPSQ
jgi:hypothetical protein